MSNNIYTSILTHDNIYIDNNNITRDLENTLLEMLKYKVEGKCSIEGYIKPNSIKIKQISEGNLYANFVEFMVTYTCLAAYPVESQKISCKVKSITKVGIRAEIDDDISPFIIFLARDHHYNVPEFGNLKEDDIINIRVLGQRFEINDVNICIIAEFIGKNNSVSNNDLQEQDIEADKTENPLKIKKTLKIKS